MSFMKSLKGLADDFKGLIGDKDKDKEKDKLKPDQAHGEANRGQADSYYQQQPAQQYGQQPPYQQHQQQQQQQHQYGQPPQGHSAPSSGSNLPPGWVEQWDQNSQRYIYIEQATGRSQWDPPAFLPPPGGPDRGFGASPPTQYPPQGYGLNQGYPQQIGHLGGEKKKDGSKAGLVAAGVGGLAVGGLAGAALAHDSDSDEEHRAHVPPAGYGGGYSAPSAGYSGGGYNDPSRGYGVPPTNDPRALEQDPDVSSSQRSSLEEARHDYEEARREAADSDASSSDREELKEAREEYQEEVEDAQEEAYDD